MKAIARFFRKYGVQAIFGLVIVGLCIALVISDTQRANYKRELKGVYEKSFEDIVTDINSLQNKLGKFGASNSKYMCSMLLMDIWRQTGDTESSIAGMPVSAVNSAPFTQFVNRLGDYCRYLSKKISKGESLSEDDYRQIESLKETCGLLSSKFDEVWRNGFIPALEFGEAVYYMQEDGGRQENTQTLDFSNQEYPRLQYDGPFSESTENKQPKGLFGNEISREEAKNTAVKFLGQGYVKELYESDDLNGDIYAFGFNGRSEDGEFSIYITKKGGSVLYYKTNISSGVQAVPTDERYSELSDTAVRYFREKGYPDLKPSYAQFYNGMALINLAPFENDIVLYPDLVKAWVDIEKNKVVGIETKNYLMSHTKRNFEQVLMTREDAQKKLGAKLAVESSRLALIPTEQQKEVLCWEFTGKAGGTDYIIYINAQNGEEEDILQIQHTNEGALVM